MESGPAFLVSFRAAPTANGQNTPRWITRYPCLLAFIRAQYCCRSRLIEAVFGQCLEILAIRKGAFQLPKSLQLNMVGMGDSWANVLQSLISWAWVRVRVHRLSHSDEFETGSLYGIRMKFQNSVAGSAGSVFRWFHWHV